MKAFGAGGGDILELIKFYHEYVRLLNYKLSGALPHSKLRCTVTIVSLIAITYCWNNNSLLLE